MNSKYFSLPFALTFGGVLGFLVSVVLAIWLAKRVPVLKNWL